MVIQRARKTGDVEVISFITESLDVRSLKIGDIKGRILARFSDQYATSFHTMVNGKDSTIMYQNILTNRNSAAHDGTIQMTFDEVVESHKKAIDVLTAISIVLA